MSLEAEAKDKFQALLILLGKIEDQLDNLHKDTYYYQRVGADRLQEPLYQLEKQILPVFLQARNTVQRVHLDLGNNRLCPYFVLSDYLPQLVPLYEQPLDREKLKSLDTSTYQAILNTIRVNKPNNLQ
jgi:hypothetical protein